jgi:formyl-CoA transferase
VTVDPPLSGIRVLDFTRFLAGPFCTQQLGDLGADVIKVESPNRGREFSSADGRDTYFFLSANRSKRSLGLDIEKPEGVELLLRLLPRFDVLVENFRPGVMDRFGLGPARLTEHHPRLVYVSISGFGSTGPYRDRPGFDQIAQGMSGVMSLTGWGAGMYFEAGRVPGPAGHHHPLSSPYGRFRASDGYVNIAAGGQHIWERLCSALDREDWKQDPRFADPGSRLRNRDTLSSELEKELARATVGEWVERINAAGVPCGPVYTMDQVFEDPQVVARDMCVELPHPVLGKFRTTGLPLKFDQTAARVERRPPLLGEHTDEILEELDVSKSERSTLRENRIIGS